MNYVYPGSERIAKSDVKGVRQAEALNINKSLTTFARVIKELGAQSRSGGSTGHVPYRGT